MHKLNDAPYYDDSHHGKQKRSKEKKNDRLHSISCLLEIIYFFLSLYPTDQSNNGRRSGGVIIKHSNLFFSGRPEFGRIGEGE